jgi:hypothetical protein
VQQDTSQVSKVAEMQIMELREQLVAFKVRNRDVEEERKVVKGKVRKEREAMKGFEDGYVKRKASAPAWRKRMICSERKP